MRTGRPKLQRISLFCHTGFETDRKFLLSIDSCRRGLRQEYFRRYLSVGYLLGHKKIESGTPPKDGRSRLIRIVIQADDPILVPFLDEYRRRGSIEWRGHWVRETILAGYEILSGKVSIPGETGGKIGQDCEDESGPVDSEDIFGGLFN